MIRAHAKLINGPAFFVGENISCSVVLSNTATAQDSRPSSRDDYETLAWASAQIVGICTVNPQKVSDAGLPPVGGRGTSGAVASTSLSPSRGERGSVFFSTKPKILVCDLSLLTGQEKECVYEETLPCELPPSFRGQSVKYSYKIKIGLQRVGAAVKMLHLPLRLMTWQSLETPNFCDDDETGIMNPFSSSTPQDSQLDHALEFMQALNSRRSPSVYKVTNGQGKVVSLCLFKNSYRLGEDIVGTLDFTDAVVSCMQYSVTLQSEECIAEEKRRRTGSSVSTTENNLVVAHSKCHEFSLGFMQTHISLPVPLHVTPSFSTDLVTLKWRLHFEFVTTIQPVDWSGENDQWQPPGVVDIETMVWDFPILVYPTVPSHVSKTLYVSREATITL